MVEDLMTAALNEKRLRFVTACLADDLPAAQGARRGVKALMEEIMLAMQEDIDAVRKRLQRRKEGR